MDIQTIYQDTIKYAAGKHESTSQKVPGTNLPYVVHLSNVAMEILITSRHTDNFNLELALKAALLHDILEDTGTTKEEFESHFGADVTHGVLALTKNEDLPKEDQMADSLKRIKAQPLEIWAVKLADRITNLQKPPSTWSNEKKIKYHDEAQIILDTLGSGNAYLASRLSAKIKEYESYINS